MGKVIKSMLEVLVATVVAWVRQPKSHQCVVDMTYCTISIDLAITHHTHFFLTLEIIFSQFFRFSEIFRKHEKVTCCSLIPICYRVCGPPDHQSVKTHN